MTATERLIDTETVYAEVVLALCHEVGLTSWTAEVYWKNLVGIPLADGFRFIEKALAARAAWGRCRGADRGRRRGPAGGRGEGAPGRAGRRPRLAARRCVASSTSLEPLRHNLALAGLIDLFDPHIFSASQVARGKPEPDVFLFAAAQMDVAPARCLVLEDSVPGVLAARAAGMRVAGFTGASHDKPGLRERLLAAGAAAVVEDYAEWPRTVAALGA